MYPWTYLHNYNLSIADSAKYTIPFDWGQSTAKSLNPVNNGHIICGQISSDNNRGLAFKINPDLSAAWYYDSGESQNSEAFCATQTNDTLIQVLINTTRSGKGKELKLAFLDTAGTESRTGIVYGGTGDDVGHHAIKTWDNGSLIVGETESFGAGKKDLWVLRCDMYGDTLWTATYGDTGDQCGMYVAQTADTGYVITGYTTSGGYGGQDAWVVRLESENTVGEMNILGTDDGDRSNRIRNLTVTTDTAFTMYAAGYGLVDHYVGSRDVAWSFISISDSFASDTTVSGSLVFDPDRPGSGKIVATYEGPRRTVSCTTGIITVLPGSLHHVTLAPTVAGTTVTTDDTLTMRCIGYDTDGNSLGDTAASWFAAGTLDDNAFGTLAGAVTSFSQKVPGTGYLHCRLNAGVRDSIQVTVEPGRLAILAIRDSADNKGTEIGSLQLETGQTVTLHVAGYDAYGNYKSDVEASWYSIQDAPFFAYITGLTDTYDFTPSITGRGYLVARTGGVEDTTGIITVIQNLPPAVSLSNPAGIQIDDVVLPFSLTDTENDTLSIAAEYSTDKGVTWLAASVSGPVTAIDSSLYADTLTWHSKTDLNGWVSDSILFRVMPSDKKAGTGDTTAYFRVRNILGDYNRDMTIDFDDLAEFTMAWHTADTARDIGPVSGLVPELLLVPDGYVEFEDLYTFVLMWDWCYRDSIADPAGYLSKQAAGSAPPVSLVNTEDGWSVTITGIPEPMAISLHMSYDPTAGNIENLRQGSSLNGFGCNPVFLQRTDNENGSAVIQAALLDGSWMQDDTMELASIDGALGKDAGITYDIRDFNNIPIARGSAAITTVQPVLPDNGDITVLSNPFRTSVTIRMPENGKPVVILDTEGKTVRTLSGNTPEITWDGTDDNGRQVPAGIYCIAGEGVRLIKLR